MAELYDTVKRISFDWYNDYSSWRLEDLSDKLNNAYDLLKKYKLEFNVIENVLELENFSKLLRNLYKNNIISDSDARSALYLSDELYFDTDIMGFDTEIAYSDQIDYLKSSFEEWSKDKDILFTNEEWGVDLEVILDRMLNSKNGLGNSWSFEINSDFIELSDGIIVYGFKYDIFYTKEFISLLEYHISYQDDLGDLLLWLKKYNNETIAKLSNFLIAIDESIGLDTLVKNDVEYIIDNILVISNDKDLVIIAETINSLAKEWNSSFSDLLKVTNNI
jgi:hypothetical protein